MFREKGLSLVELMIAITLGLILMSGVVKVFLNSKATYSTQQALSRIQETGRLAIEFVSRDVRMAGYNGCGSRSSGGITVTNTLNNASSFVWNFGDAIKGYTSDTSGTTALPASHGLLPVPYYAASPPVTTDIISIRGARGSGTQITQNNNGAQVFVAQSGSPVTVAGGCGSTDSVSGMCQGDVVMATDCTKARVFQITNLTTNGTTDVNVVHSGSGSSPGNAISSWGGNSAPDNEIFKAGAELLSATSITYFIATGTSGRQSLFQNINGVNSELLEGVENMSVTYGEDTNPSDPDYVPDVYRSASAVANWSRVDSVRVEFLVASIEDRVLSDHQKYIFNNASVTATDYRLRQTFSTTIGIRSRLF
jgi:type IV pilus assembly protein PilW